MAKKFSELRKRMSPEAQARVQAKASVLIEEINSRFVIDFDTLSTRGRK